MTSGEAFWRDCVRDAGRHGRLCAITAAPRDAADWAGDLPVRFTDDIAAADAVLLMGLPEGSDGSAEWVRLSAALKRGLPLICTNPDRASPRSGAQKVGPGALAHRYAGAGGAVTFYGKPHLPVFRAVERALDSAPGRLLMVGDSLEHDIAGGHAAGWRTLFVQGGLAAGQFDGSDPVPVVAALARAEGTPLPDYTIRIVR